MGCMCPKNMPGPNENIDGDVRYLTPHSEENRLLPGDSIKSNGAGKTR